MDAFVKIRRAKSVEEKDEQKESAELGCGPDVAGKPAWPLYLPSISDRHSLKRQRSDESTGYLPDFSSSSSSDERPTYGSSPLSYDDDSEEYDTDFCSDIEATIQRAQNHSWKLYKHSYEVTSSPRDRSPLTRETTSLSVEVAALINNKSPLLVLDANLMANVFSYIDPEESLRVLTMPLCKEWHQSFGSSQDLWRILCLMEPFNASAATGVVRDNDNSSEDEDSSSDEDSFCSLSQEPTFNKIFGKYRLMFTSFVRCRKYLMQIREDSRNGKAPSVADLGQSGFPHFGASKGLKKFLARKKGSVLERNDALVASNDESANVVSSSPIGVSDDDYSTTEDDRKRKSNHPEPAAKKVKYGNSMITKRLFSSTEPGQPSYLSLPTSCAIYSLVNWMVAYPEVEGIQTMCIETLPCLLEDEGQRLNAQNVGLVEVVLRAMLQYPNSLKLHIGALHTMVLLARPLGGREGMLFDNSASDLSSDLGFGGAPSARAAFPSAAPDASGSATRAASALNRVGRSGLKQDGINGIAIMLDSMRRFENEAKLQAVGCWALVNLALVPAQKNMIISLGGIQTTINAMLRHPHDYDVQFRALFALINVVVPCKEPKELIRYHRMGPCCKTEKDVLDSAVKQIAELVVLAMKNFCASQTILNRACLVLHNLSQSPDYLTTLLWTHHCYQMLEWCIANHPTDHVLCRSAISSLHRLQVLMSGNESLRQRFTESIRAEQGLFQN